MSLQTDNQSQEETRNHGMNNYLETEIYNGVEGDRSAEESHHNIDFEQAIVTTPIEQATVLSVDEQIKQVCLRGPEEVKQAIEAKMIEIAQLLGITLEGCFRKIQALVQKMVEQDRKRNIHSDGRKEGKKPKRSRELSNLIIYINYDRQGGEKKRGDKSVRK